MATTLYIAPSAGDIHRSALRVLLFDGYISASAGDHYRQHPELWGVVGLVNSQGRLARFAGPPWHVKELVGNYPLIAGLVFKFD